MRLLILSLCALLIAGCSYISPSATIQNRDKEYLSATSIPPLRVPSGISSSAIHSYYPIADRHYAEEAKKVDLIPPGLNS